MRRFSDIRKGDKSGEKNTYENDTIAADSDENPKHEKSYEKVSGI